jgi:hypothetical protein
VIAQKAYLKIVYSRSRFLGYEFYIYSTQSNAFYALEVELTDIGTPRVVDVFPPRAEIPLYFKYTNPTGHDSPNVYIMYEFYVGDELITSQADRIKVPANSYSTTIVTFYVHSGYVGSALWNAIITGNFTVTVKGEMSADHLFGSMSRSFLTSYTLT